MKVLYVVASCLNRNTSANMSHNAYVQGLLENGCNVTILMAKDSWGEFDRGLPSWEQAQYYSYASVAFLDRLRKKFQTTSTAPSAVAANNSESFSGNSTAVGKNLKQKLRSCMKTIFYKLFPRDPCYPLEKTWLKRAAKFKSSEMYDLVVSNSSPAASHKLVAELIKKGRISCKRWIQIWEDPWYYDLYGGHSKEILREEHALLRQANEIYYVSPLTLKYQKELFADCAEKMKHIPLPYLVFSKDDGILPDECTFGYFGDYYSHTRNLKPFYDAIASTDFKAYIFGDSDLRLTSTDHIKVSGRVTLDVLEEVQQKTRVLVHLCNLRGGQIPGKIYHYSATNKPILFILDGTEEEQMLLRGYFESFGRYYFCENSLKSISFVLQRIHEDSFKNKRWTPLEVFSPKTVVASLIK